MTLPSSSDDARLSLFPSSGSNEESRRIGELLRTETVGGAILLLMAALAIAWANSPWSGSYFALRDIEVGYAPWHLKLTLAQWASDGALAIFFFLVGLELKREFLIGDLRRFGTAIVPILAAAGGVITPALFYLGVTSASPSLHGGWAIPTATDIAFAVAVLALIGSHLPGPLRIFLLTLAVVDDLIAIVIIAIFYTESIHLIPLLAGAAVIALYALLAQRYRQIFRLRPATAWLILFPIGVIAWAFIHASGIHATIAGVVLAFTIPVNHRASDGVGDDEPGLSEVFEHRFRPLSSGLAIPLFAFFATGVQFGGSEGMRSTLADPVTLGIMAGLVLGKPVGIVVTTWIATRLRRINLDPALRWIDIIGVGLLAGIGFTVSLLVTELSFAPSDPHHDHAKVAIMLSSLIAAAAASVVLGARNRHYRKAELADAEADAE